MTMWAFAKFLLQSRWTRVLWFLLPTIWLGGYGSKILAASTWRIGMLNRTTVYYIWSRSESRQIQAKTSEFEDLFQECRVGII